MPTHHRAKKNFGQNFLQDDAIIGQIIQAIYPKSTDHMIEIGPGLGALTKPILPAVEQLDVIEIDNDLIAPLEKLKQAHPKLTIRHQDALTFEFNQYKGSKQLRIIGNLPYNISTPLLFHLLSYKDLIKDMHFMLQKEVVQRICAEPNTKAYGRLSVMLQYYCHTEMLFLVPPTAFSPPPKVDSAILRLIPKTSLEPTLTNPKHFAKLVKQAFSQRRKTLKNTLKTMDCGEALSELGIDKKMRAEQVSVENFARLSNRLTATE